MGGGSLFPPCLLAFSPSGEQSPSPLPCYRRPSSSDCANAQPFAALVIPAPYSVAGCSRGSPALSLRRAPALSLPPEFVLPAVALAPPRFHPARRAFEFLSVGCRGSSRLPRGQIKTRTYLAVYAPRVVPFGGRIAIIDSLNLGFCYSVSIFDGIPR